MKILLVDNQTILLNGIANLLTKSAHELVERARTVDEALNYFSDTGFDMLITDFSQIDDHDLALLRKIKRIYPNLKVVVLNMQDESFIAREILKNDPANSMTTTGNRFDLADLIRSLNKDKIRLNENIREILAKTMTEAASNTLLTDREQEVLRLLAADCTPAEIAGRLGITERTVNNHCKSIYHKTKTSTVTGLLKYAYANHLL